MSPQRDLHYHFPPQGVPGALFPYLASFSQQHFSLLGIVFVCLFPWCLSHPPGAPSRQGPCCLVPTVSPGRWQSMKVFAEWTVPFPVSPILSVLSPLSCLVCVPLFLSVLIHIFLILSSVSHLHVSLWVCLSHMHPLHPQPGPGTGITLLSFGYTKRYMESARLGTPASLSHSPCPAPVLFWPRVL